MTCAPFLALRVIQRLVTDEGHRFPRAVPILQRHIYVDDVLFGDNDIASLKQTRDQLISLLGRGLFELRKWASNSSSLLDDINPSNHGLACSKAIASDEQVKILGIVWNPSRDLFQFRVCLDRSVPRSKRSILSTIARLYDPLGWVTPVTTSAKIFMQRLWCSKLDWDTEVSGILSSQWQTIYAKLTHLNEVTLPRWTGVQPHSAVELHGFSDASTMAYAAVVYLKVTSPLNVSHISLLASKSKVAPISPLTVPRLELAAAVLLSRLMKFIRTSLHLESASCFCWTDSMIVLTWLRSHPSRWATFVANRVHAVQTNMMDALWSYVPTSSNPADCASRGIPGDELLSHPLWWHGPPWLASAREEWPPEPTSYIPSSPLEEKVVSLHSQGTATQWDLAVRFSSWSKLVNVTAYLYRFIDACRRRNRESTRSSSTAAPLRADECYTAKIFWLKYIQATLFPAELRALSAGRPVASGSPISSLTPFVDKHGVLRVGGRLQQAPLPYDVRHPIILASHPIVTLLAQRAHIRTLHGGLQLTLTALRSEYWIIRARSLIKSVIHRCVVCVRERASIPTQLMGNLPAVRVSPPPRSFSHCGVDYAGPLHVRASAGRGVTSRKAYVALFVCLSTRAIHLELVSDYSASAFLGAFTRFTSRRGLPQTVYSDNGTTFVGAEKELTIAYRAALRDASFQHQTASDHISWHFIPPSAPHFGGIWEAGVRSMKHHLRRVLGSHTLTFEELTTLLCKIEACLNSRPLAPLSDSVDDYQVLTPGHFLIGSSLITPPEPSVLHLSENRLSRWQLVRHLTERFWSLWTNDYINTLQQRRKWRKAENPLPVGRLVLLRNPNLPPCKWEFGRIAKAHPGPDGLIRVVTVKTASSEYTRPIGKLCLLPIETASP
ncbi:PREDICTED: uncharacterized protein LOC105555679 [Vollenhovia emeryi]|uniref:uncharacterized protein LOC105555679 n=1 Tax=Vollenhovia emeryi TaxID=411798 RepID=UPI0005F3A30F|nr:PREDICTED: uncharacterized protein LOC105555679 [Vollenhovia emeryi]